MTERIRARRRGKSALLVPRTPARAPLKSKDRDNQWLRPSRSGWATYTPTRCASCWRNH